MKSTAAESQLPPELLGSVPRDVRLTGGGIALASVAVLFAVGAIAAGVVMSTVYLRTTDERQRRDREAVTATAEVVQIQLKRGDGPHRIVTYRYDVDGRSYTGRTALRNSDRRPLARGDSVSIGVVPSDPEHSWMIGYTGNRFPVWLIPLVVFGLISVALLIGRSLRRQWILLSEGRVARARVTALKKVSSDKGTRYRVTYEFTTLSGALQRSRSEVGKTPPAVGALVPVVYHRDRPSWTMTYPMPLVRPERQLSTRKSQLSATAVSER